MNGEGWGEGGKEEEKGEGGRGGGRERKKRRREREGGGREGRGGEGGREGRKRRRRGESRRRRSTVRSYDTVIDSMDMCFHKLFSEGENHFTQWLKDRDVSCKEAISNETPYLMERVWLAMGMLIDR